MAALLTFNISCVVSKSRRSSKKKRWSTLIGQEIWEMHEKDLAKDKKSLI